MAADLGKLQTDAPVWLTPKTIGASRVCWREPRASVVRVEHPYVVVLIDGAEHRVHVDNVRTTDPAAREPRGLARPKPPPQWDGYEQPTML
uniref:hypothetical protein n=1 Tax=Actinoplanes sp. CA-151224 TaxID=3239904 RepID=UPI003F4930C4